MILTIGEILYDLFPNEKRLGGAPFNFAAHLRAFGFPVTFISRVGPDPDGAAIIDFAEKRGFDTRHIQKDPDHPTGHVNVTLDDKGAADYEIVPDVAYDHIEFNDAVAEALAAPPKLIYFGTLIQRTDTGAETVRRILEGRAPSTRCLYDINLRKNCYTEAIIRKSLVHCDILKLNVEELHLLQKMFGTDESYSAFACELMRDYDIEWISLTLGEGGSTLFSADTTSSANMERSPEIVDTVGAGDAYAAVLTAGYLKGWGPEMILKRAARFASDICEIRGALPKAEDFYEKYAHWFDD